MVHQRRIYRFKHHLINRVKTPLKVTDRAKSLFSDGQGGDVPATNIPAYTREGGTVAAQGYVGFLNLITGEIELDPAWNKDDGKERVNFEYKGKHYGVVSQEPLGSRSNSGDVHIQGLIQLGLADKGGVNGEIAAFGIFKGNGTLKNPKPLIFEFRNNSSSQNGFAFQYEEAFLLYHYEPDFNKYFKIKRSIPSEIASQIQGALIRQLPLANSQTRAIHDNFVRDQYLREQQYLEATDEEISHRLIENMFIAAKNGDYEILERIYALRNLYPQVISDIKFSTACQKLLIPAIKTNRYETVKILLENCSDAEVFDDNGVSALCYAANSKDKRFFDLLIQRSSNPNHALKNAKELRSSIAIARLLPVTIVKQIKDNLLLEIEKQKMDRNQKSKLIDLSTKLNNCEYDMQKIKKLLPKILKQISSNQEYKFSKYLPFTFLNKKSQFYEKIASLRHDCEDATKISRM